MVYSSSNMFQVQVKVISLGALCTREAVLSALTKAVNGGYWLVFNDCHLLDQWDDKVVAHLIQLLPFKGRWTSRSHCELHLHDIFLFSDPS